MRDDMPKPGTHAYTRAEIDIDSNLRIAENRWVLVSMSPLLVATSTIGTCIAIAFMHYVLGAV